MTHIHKKQVYMHKIDKKIQTQTQTRHGHKQTDSVEACRNRRKQTQKREKEDIY